MSRRRAIMAAGFGATLLGLGVVTWGVWFRGDQGTTRLPITSASIVMLGDSITEQGPWDTAFPGRSIVNQGYSGFTTAQLVDVAREVAAQRPQAVYVLTGTNDIRDGHPPEWTIQQLEVVLEQLQTAAPDTTVVLQTILPREDRPNEVLATNEAIRQLAADRGIDLLELHAAFDDGVGALRAEDTVDGLHLSEAGNRRWVALLADDYARR